METPYALYHQPTHQLVADFIGRGVLLNGEIREHQLHCAFGIIEHSQLHNKPDMSVNFLVRPDDVLINNDSSMQAIVVGCGFVVRIISILWSWPTPVTCWRSVHHTNR